MAAAAIPAQAKSFNSIFDVGKRALRKEQARFSLMPSFSESRDQPTLSLHSTLNTEHSSLLVHRYVRLLLVTLAIAGCLMAIRAALTYGAAHVLITYSLSSGNVAAARKATQLTPNNAEAHFAGAAVLSLSGAPDQSTAELDQAAALRPADYSLWMQLGLLRDQTGDTVGALLAFDEAVKRAPYYAQPRWDRGNVLVRSQQYDAAFKDLTEAAQSNPELMPGLIELAWGLSRGDVKLTEQLAQINTEKMRIAFAKLLVRKGRAQDAIAQFGGAANVPESLKQELTDQLIGKGAFKEAFEVWRGGQGISQGNGSPGPSIYDGGFEGTLSFGEGGFAWRVPRDLQATSISLDSSQPHSGVRSLRIEFGGNSNAAITQLILLAPATHYRINFAARSQEVVTGGLPYLAVSDASGDLKRLGQSVPLAKGTTNWQPYSFEFTTTSSSSAVVLSLQRENCSTSPCPIFGSVSLDSFSIEQLR
jgi:tetratricopeptide (TPR) repeat protein